MRALLVFPLIAIVAAAQAPPLTVPSEVRALLAPTLETWRKLQTDSNCKAIGDPQNYPGHCYELEEQWGSQLLLLSYTKGVTADEAVAALFSFGLSKKQPDQGHDLICIAAARGDRMIKPLIKYRTCDLDLSAEYPKSTRSEISACQRAIDRAIHVIRAHTADKTCVWD